MEVQSIKEFAAAKGFTTVASHVRVNTNGYPYVTFINEKNEAENVYFSKKGAESVSEGTTVTAELLKQFQIGTTTNAAGEERVKLISNSERVSLMEMFA
jgi:Na+-transporting NADH:ubiquinone oxidoreductase subunit NqrA